MKRSDLVPAVGSRTKKVRRGRGDGSGSGNYSGRGMKGQNARAGGGVRVGFEGGQTPLLRRTPKQRGFRNPNRVEFLAINFHILEKKFSDGEVVSPATLLEKRIIRNLNKPVKILATGTLTKQVSFEGITFSKSAESVLQNKKGSVPKKKSSVQVAPNVSEEAPQ
ncbi:50S ribosomal protein L15 [Candidatus Peregrinibacteria bacterium]|nr:MAG: 50S ribosomal protein L15 [Candidatus Peregrinibacteria bacterium]